MWFVVLGEAKPKVYTELSAARRACTSPLWEVKAFHSLAEASAARAKALGVGAATGDRKRARATTEVLSSAEFAERAGVAEESRSKREEGFGKWLLAQQGGETSFFYDADRAREERQRLLDFLEERKRRRAEEKRRQQEEREKRSRPSAGSSQRAPPSPPRVSAVDAALKVLLLNVVPSSLAELKSVRKKLILKYHPDKNPDDPEASQKTMDVYNAFDLLSKRFPEEDKR